MLTLKEIGRNINVNIKRNRAFLCNLLNDESLVRGFTCYIEQLVKIWCWTATGINSQAINNPS